MHFQSYRTLKNARFMTSMGRKGYQMKGVEDILQKIFSPCSLVAKAEAHLARARAKTLCIPTK